MPAPSVHRLNHLGSGGCLRGDVKDVQGPVGAGRGKGMQGVQGVRRGLMRAASEVTERAASMAAHRDVVRDSHRHAFVFGVAVRRPPPGVLSESNTGLLIYFISSLIHFIPQSLFCSACRLLIDSYRFET